MRNPRRSKYFKVWIHIKCNHLCVWYSDFYKQLEVDMGSSCCTCDDVVYGACITKHEKE